MVPFLSGVHMWILNGKSNQLLKWSSILHTCSMPWLRALCEWVGWPLVVISRKEGLEIHRYSDLLRLPQAEDPHWHAPTTGMQTASELSHFGSQLLGRAISNGRIIPSGLVSAVLRESAEALFSLGKLLSACRVLFACWMLGVWEERAHGNHRLS